VNPFEQLRADDTVPAQPDPAFAARLRRAVEAALAPDLELPVRAPHTTETGDDTMPASETIMSTTDRGTTGRGTTGTGTGTPAVQVLTPYLAVHDAAAAIDWYADALGATEHVRYVGDDGRIGHAEIEVRGARIFLSDAYPEIGVVAARDQEGSSMSLHLEVDDVDTLHHRAVERGAGSEREPADQSHGARSATIVDPFGHRWMLSQQIAAPTLEEIDAATEGFTVVAAGAAAGPSGDRPIQLGYYTIHTDDVPTAAAFYSKLFGWNVDPATGHVDNCDLPFGFESQYPEGGYHLWMKVDDPEPVLARLAELGGTVVADVEYASGRGIECRDNQGNRFDLHKPAPGYE
jgi:uncharacterized glyoxalase superfamily protein PhnB